MKKKGIIAFFETLIALCIVLDCESIWKWMDHSAYFRIALVFCYIASLAMLVFLYGKIYRKEHVIAFLALYLSVLLFYNAFVNYSRFMDTVQLVLCLFLMVLYFKKTQNIAHILERCSRILYFLACMSLFFWFFGSVLHVFAPSQQITIYVSNVPKVCKSYFFLHYEVQKEEILAGLYRNTGIFYEGPKYVLLLAAFLAYELFLTGKPAYKRCVIFTITALSTFTMTGIYAIGLIWLMFFFMQFSAKTTRGLFLRIAFMIVLFLVGIQAVSYLEDMFSLKSATASYRTRMDNYLAGFKAWKEHLLMGAGYLNMDTIMAHYSSFRLNDIGYSNSIFRVLAQGGLYLAIIYIIPVIKALTSGIKERNGKFLAFVLVYLYFFITTSFPYNYVNHLYLLIMYFGMHKYSASDVAVKHAVRKKMKGIS